jgi:general secretion pathway protein L
MYHLIKMPIDLTQPALWLTFDDTFTRIWPEPRQIPLDQLSTLPNDAYVAVVLPGQRVRTLQMPMPQAKHAELKRALPFAVEDQVVDNIDDLYIAPGIYAKGVQNALVVDKSYFDAIYRLLKKQCMVLTTVTPDFLSLNWLPNTWSLCFLRGNVYWRYGEQQGATISKDEFADVWAIILEQHKEDMPKAISVFGHEEENAGYFDDLPVPVTWGDDGVALDQKGLYKTPAFNFLQGAYRLKARMSQVKKCWVQAISALVVVLVLVFLGNLSGWLYLNHESKRIHVEAEAIGAHLGLSASNANFRTDMDHMLSALSHMKKDDVYLHLLSECAGVFHDHQEWQMQSMTYAAPQLRIGLVGHAGTNTAPLINALRALSLNVSIKKGTSTKTSMSYLVTLEQKK